MPDINFLQENLAICLKSPFYHYANCAKIRILLFNADEDTENTNPSYPDKLQLIFEQAKKENLQGFDDSEIKKQIKIVDNNCSIKIDQQFLMKKELAFKSFVRKNPELKNKKQFLETGISTILLYPSITSLPVKLFNKYAKIKSMIPGRAQHYIKEIVLCENKNKSNFHTAFNYSEATKLYFVEKLSCEQDKSVLKNLVLKTNKDNTDYIYQDQAGNYRNKSGQIISAKAAQETIKNWILRTTPAKEAIHEATAGIENIFKFRAKISQITKEENGTAVKNEMFKDMFSPAELGKKIKHT